MKQNNKTGLIGLTVIAISAANFLENPFTGLGLIEFVLVCFGVSYLVMELQDEKPRKKMHK